MARRPCPDGPACSARSIGEYRLEHLAPTALASVDVPAARAAHPARARGRRVACTRRTGRRRAGSRAASRRSCRSASARIASSRTQSPPRCSRQSCRRMPLEADSHRDASRSTSTRSRATTALLCERVGAGRVRGRREGGRVRARRRAGGAPFAARRLPRFFVATLAEVAELRALAPGVDDLRARRRRAGEPSTTLVGRCVRRPCCARSSRSSAGAATAARCCTSTPA